MTLGSYALWGLLAPAACVGVVLLLAWVSREAAEKAARGWLGAAAFAGAFLVGQAASLGGVPPFPPVQADDRLFWLVAGTGVLAGGESLLSERRWPRLVLRSLYAFFVPWFLLARLLERRETLEVLWTVGGLGLALLLGWSALAAWSSRRSGASVPLVLWYATSATAAALMLSHTAKYAQLAGILAACLGAAAVVAWIRPSLVLGAGAAGVVSVLLACFLVAGVWLAATPLPLESALLLAVAPLVPTVAEVGPLSRLAPPRAVLARLALVTLAIAPAVFLAWVEAPPASPY